MSFYPDYLGGGFAATFTNITTYNLTVTGDFSFSSASVQSLFLGNNDVIGLGNTVLAPHGRILSDGTIPRLRGSTYWAVGTGSSIRGLNAEGDLVVNRIESLSTANFNGQVNHWSTFVQMDNTNMVFGNNQNYWFRYTLATGQFQLWSTDVSGTGTDGSIFTVTNGSDTIAFTGNVQVGKRLLSSASIATSGAGMTLGPANYIVVSGNTTLQRINTVGYTIGTEVILEFVNTPTVQHGVASSGSYATILLSGSANWNASAGAILRLVLTSAGWRQSAPVVTF